MKLQGNIAIVTGGTKGIGYGIACALAAEGARIVVVSRTAQDCERVAAEIKDTYGVETLALPTDVTETAQVEAMVQQTIERFSRIDILINNAGGAITKDAVDLTEEDWDKVLNLDLKSVFFCAQAVGKHMIEQGGGKIVNVASVLGLVADKRVLPYCVSKAGVLHMTKALALEWARHNVRVNAICPGYVVTDINRDELNDEKIKKALLSKFAIRRYAEVSEMTGAVVYMCSDESSYMTGQAMVIDGGWTCA
ncbi:MAG: SDR family oxidoreductase [Oscillospiraceae bacterium]|nr:SDR family oxidoreductase [Oscillospiraceae bacterium]